MCSSCGWQIDSEVTGWRGPAASLGWMREDLVHVASMVLQRRDKFTAQTSSQVCLSLSVLAQNESRLLRLVCRTAGLQFLKLVL
jgi:hypothetical protein